MPLSPNAIERLFIATTDRTLGTEIAKAIDTVNFLPAKGYGIEINSGWAWHDLIGELAARATGGTAPSLGAWRGGIAQVPFWDATDIATLSFHIPHDYVPGSDLHLHLHWGHNGTAISGSLVVTFGVTYAKGHNVAAFPAETTASITVATPDIATIPRWSHRLNEIQISSSTPNANQINSSLIEPDGILMVGMQMTTIPTITGGAPNAPAAIFCDVHYQSTGIGTVSRAPYFWTPK